MINPPKKFGNMYIKTDTKTGNLLYGFIVNGRTIEKFINPSDNIPICITLPILNEDLTGAKGDTSKDKKEKLINYVEGNIQIASGCFEGIKNATIVVPQNSSVALCAGSFDKDARVEFILPPNMEIKKITHSHDTGIDRETSWYPLLADSRLKGSLSVDRDNFSVKNYDNTFNHHFNILVNKDFCVDVKNFKVASRGLEKFKITSKPRDLLYSFWFLTTEDWHALTMKILAAAGQSVIPATRKKWITHKPNCDNKLVSDNETAYIEFKTTKEGDTIRIALTLNDISVYVEKETEGANCGKNYQRAFSKQLTTAWAQFLLEYGELNKASNNTMSYYE